MTKPFRMRYGADFHSERGINLADPVDANDAVNKNWTEQRIADGSRYRGKYDPDVDGEGSALPQLSTYLIGNPSAQDPNRAQNADYWIVSRSAQNRDDLFRYLPLTTGDRITAQETDSAVEIAAQLGGGTVPNLKPNWNYWVPADSPNGGRGLGLWVSTDPAGDGSIQVSNRGSDYTQGETFSVKIENIFNDTISTVQNTQLQPFTLDPNTTYYEVLVSGGTGIGILLNIRTDATGQAFSDIYLISGGSGFTVGDVLTLTVEGQVVGTVDVASVYTGTDQTFTLEIVQIHANPELTFDLVRGSGLTKQQADLDYLRLDGGNKPNKDVDWNDYRITSVGDAVDAQDAVNLRTLRESHGATYYRVSQPGNTFSLGDPLYLDTSGTWQLAKADDEATLAWGVCSPIDVSDFYLYVVGEFQWSAHGYPVGSDVYLSQTTAGGYDAPRQRYGLIQQVFVVIDANTVQVVNQAAQEL